MTRGLSRNLPLQRRPSATARNTALENSFLYIWLGLGFILAFAIIKLMKCWYNPVISIVVAWYPWPHPYRLMRHLRSVSYAFVGILYSRRLILLYSNHLEGRQTVENHHVRTGTQRTHILTSSISILVHFFAVFIFVEAGLSAKIAKICTQ